MLCLVCVMIVSFIDFLQAVIWRKAPGDAIWNDSAAVFILSWKKKEKKVKNIHTISWISDFGLSGLHVCCHHKHIIQSHAALFSVWHGKSQPKEWNRGGVRLLHWKLLISFVSVCACVGFIFAADLLFMLCACGHMKKQFHTISSSSPSSSTTNYCILPQMP